MAARSRLATTDRRTRILLTIRVLKIVSPVKISKVVHKRLIFQMFLLLSTISVNLISGMCFIIRLKDATIRQCNGIYRGPIILFEVMNAGTLGYYTGQLFVLLSSVVYVSASAFEVCLLFKKPTKTNKRVSTVPPKPSAPPEATEGAGLPSFRY